MKEDKDGTFLIEYPHLTGCISCGNTMSEVIEMGRDAKKPWLATALEKGIPIPEPKDTDEYSGSFRIRMPKS